MKPEGVLAFLDEECKATGDKSMFLGRLYSSQKLHCVKVIALLINLGIQKFIKVYYIAKIIK